METALPTSIDRQPQTDVVRMAVYPNPASDKLQAEVQSDESREVVILLLDARGQLVYKDSAPRQIYAGVNLMSLDVGQLSSGHYTLQIADSSTQWTKSVLIQR